MLLFPQGVPFTCEWPTIDLRIVRLPTREIASRAAAHAGLEPADFRFESLAPATPTLARYCANTIGYVHSLVASPGSPAVEPLVQAAAMDTIAAAVLAAFPHNAADDRPTGRLDAGTPASVRRALEFIEAHAREPLTLEEIARSAGVGPRALQEAFRRHRGTTPLAHLRETRLERAHRELQAADPGRRGDRRRRGRPVGFRPPRPLRRRLPPGLRPRAAADPAVLTAPSSAGCQRAAVTASSTGSYSWAASCVPSRASASITRKAPKRPSRSSHGTAP